VAAFQQCERLGAARPALFEGARRSEAWRVEVAASSLRRRGCPGACGVSTLIVKVSPNASRDALLGWLDDALKLSVTATPERGKANAAVEALLAERLGVPKRAVSVIAGHTQSRKRVEIAGLEMAEVRRRLDAALA